MPFVHGKNAVIILWDNGGTCRNISGDKNSATLSWSRNNPVTTTFGHDNVTRIPGIYDATFAGAGIWNSDNASGIDAVMSGIMTGSQFTLINFLPGGSLTGCPVYSACMVLNKYDMVAGVNAAVGCNWSFELGSGSITVSCAV